MEEKRYSGVVVKCKNKFLTCKRNAHMPFPGVWSIPGGKVEEDETTLEAARREFFEETNININDENLHFVGVIPRTNRKGDKVKGFMYAYLLDVKNEIIPDLSSAKDGEEHTECKYVSIEEFNKINLDSFLKKLIRVLSTK